MKKYKIKLFSMENLKIINKRINYIKYKNTDFTNLKIKSKFP